MYNHIDKKFSVSKRSIFSTTISETHFGLEKPHDFILLIWSHMSFLLHVLKEVLYTGCLRKKSTVQQIISILRTVTHNNIKFFRHNSNFNVVAMCVKFQSGMSNVTKVTNVRA